MEDDFFDDDLAAKKAELDQFMASFKDIAAIGIRSMYVSFIEVGFNEDQAYGFVQQYFDRIINEVA